MDGWTVMEDYVSMISLIDDIKETQTLDPYAEVDRQLRRRYLSQLTEWN